MYLNGKDFGKYSSIPSELVVDSKATGQDVMVAGGAVKKCVFMTTLKKLL